MIQMVIIEGAKKTPNPPRSNSPTTYSYPLSLTMATSSAEMATLVEEREDFMVSSSESSPILRPAHFLTVSHNSILGSAIHPPPVPEPVFNSDLDTHKESNINLNFRRCHGPSSKWKEWVDLMYSKHQTLWKKVGILDAVLNSKYTIYPVDELMHAFAARWCSETNTFVFPWGEATLTLEDMMMLGGYSVVGDPVFSPLHTHELKAIEQKLEQGRSELIKTKTKKACHTPWLCKYMNSGNEVEHEAFLVYWLSRFVFPLVADSIMKCVFPVAIHLANGTKIALAPAVLASIYSDLNAYKKTRLSSEKRVSVSSPFNLLQIWVWERFPLLQPKPNNVKPEEPSFAKWHSLKRTGDGIVTNVTDKAVDSFIWRPYSTICGINEGNQQCLPVTSSIDEEVEAMIKCLKVSELVGIDSKCIEQYLPHRVARQFRLDQDIPTLVKRANSDQQLAWETYSRPVANRIFYIPSHLYEPNVTVKYLDWWKKPMSTPDIERETLEDGMTLRKLKKRKLKDLARKKPGDKVSRDNVFVDNLESSKISNIGGSNASPSAAKKQDADLLVPPGYCPSLCNKGGGRCTCAKNVEKESPCPQPTHPNVQITSEEVVSKTLVEKNSNHAEENDSLSKLEARILKVDETLAALIK